MAWLSINFKSKELKRPVDIDVLMPQDGEVEKVVFLLHGAFGDRTSWLLRSQVQCFAEGRSICVVMPDGMNSFYVNTKNSYSFMNYICEELPQYLNKMFNLPQDRNDWMIAGCSMGGYGAIRCGVEAYNVFGYVASFSGALDVVDLYDDSARVRALGFWNNFGDKEELAVSDNNLYVLMRKHIEECKDTRFLLTCGWEDDLLKYNREFADAFGDDYDMYYLEKKGGHDWYFFNDSLRCAIEWFCGSPQFEEVF